LRKYSIQTYDHEYDPSVGKLLLYVRKEDRPKIIGKDGKRINEIEKRLGLSIDVLVYEPEEETILDVYETKDHVHLVFPSNFIGKDVIISINGAPLIQLTVGKSGEIKISKDTEIGRTILEAYEKGMAITAS